MNETILISGISGFLGSHIAEKLSKDNKVIGIVRKDSNNWRLQEIDSTSINFVELEDVDFETKIISLKPTVFIHCAWQGVAANNRSTWIQQGKNFNFTIQLLNIAQQAGITKFISLGSQAEYGYFTHEINEDENCNPFSAYGATKLATLNYCKAFCQQHHINWYWLRLFPLYGKREDLNWFIPLLISKALQHQQIDLTKCEQAYAYLHVSDFCKYINAIILQNNASGIYNICGTKLYRLKDIVNKISALTNAAEVFNIGKLPYRDNQVMQLKGSTIKWFNTFNIEPEVNIDEAIEELIFYYKNKL